MDSIYLADREQWNAIVNPVNEPWGSVKCEEFLE